MAQYDVVLQGERMIAVIPSGQPLDRSTTKVFLYDTDEKLWRGRRHFQAVLQRGKNWVEPDEPTSVTIDQLIPTRVLRMR